MSYSKPSPTLPPNIPPRRRRRPWPLLLLPNLSLFYLFLLSLLTIPQISALECSSTPLTQPYIEIVALDDPIWAVRQRLCLTEREGDHCVPTTGVECVVVSPPTAQGIYVRGTRRGGLVGGQGSAWPGCLNATREIINQCFDAQDRIGGNVTLPDEFYELALVNRTTDPPFEVGLKTQLNGTASTTLPSTTSTDPTSPPTTSTVESNSPSSSSGLPTSTAIGISVGVPMGTILLAIAFFILYRRRRRRLQQNRSQPPPPPSGSYSALPVVELEQPIPELITDAQSGDVGKHVGGKPRPQAPLMMVRGGGAEKGQLYSPRELPAHEGVGAELHGRSHAWEVEGSAAPVELPGDGEEGERKGKKEGDEGDEVEIEEGDIGDGDGRKEMR